MDQTNKECNLTNCNTKQYGNCKHGKKQNKLKHVSLLNKSKLNSGLIYHNSRGKVIFKKKNISKKYKAILIYYKLNSKQKWDNLLKGNKKLSYMSKNYKIKLPKCRNNVF